MDNLTLRAYIAEILYMIAEHVIEVCECPVCLQLAGYAISPSWVHCFSCGVDFNRSQVQHREYVERTERTPFVAYSRDETALKGL